MWYLFISVRKQVKLRKKLIEKPHWKLVNDVYSLAVCWELIWLLMCLIESFPLRHKTWEPVRPSILFLPFSEIFSWKVNTKSSSPESHRNTKTCIASRSPTHKHWKLSSIHFVCSARQRVSKVRKSNFIVSPSFSQILLQSVVTCPLTFSSLFTFVFWRQGFIFVFTFF